MHETSKMREINKQMKSTENLQKNIEVNGFFFLTIIYTKEKLHLKNIQQYPTGYIQNLSREKNKTLKKNGSLGVLHMSHTLEVIMKIKY